MAQRQETTAQHNHARAKFAFVALIALALLCAQSLMTTARADKRPNYGRIKISTKPAGYPLIVDGQPAGETTESERLLDLPPGTHTVEIIFSNGERWTREFNVNAGRVYCIGLAYAPKTVPIPKVPCPYPVNVSAPSTVNDGDVITFTADVAYAGSSALNYTWTVSPASARIVSGAGTPTIMVDTSGLGKQKVEATLVVDDGSGEATCRQTAQAATDVNPLQPPVVKNTCFDCFPFTAFDDTKARLDNLAIELQNNPTAQGYIIVYSGVSSRAGQADRLISRAKDYLVTTRGIDASRLNVINGGFRDTDYFELWVVPQGAQPPTATPTATQGTPAPETHRRTTRRSRRE